MASNKGRTGADWRAIRAHIIANNTHCAHCGQWVDRTLSGRHPLGPTVDHIIPLAKGGSLLDPKNLTLMHRRCNGSKGTKTDGQTQEPDRGRQPNTDGYTSRNW